MSGRKGQKYVQREGSSGKNKVPVHHLLARPSFPTLPLELILAVLNLVDDEDLYSVSLINKRLHELALPIYIRHVIFFDHLARSS